MQLHIHALCRHDSNLRLVSVNDWQPRVPVRFFLGRTRDGNIWRFRDDVPIDVCEAIESLCADEPETLIGPPRHESTYVEILSAQGPVEQAWHGPAYWFPRGTAEIESVGYAGDAIYLHEENAAVLSNSMADWLADVPHQQPFAAVVADNKAVAVCASVRITAEAHEAGVETHVSHRHKGYALSAVSAWAIAVEATGALPLYSTSSENRVSQAVAARLGLVQYGSDFHII